MVDRQDVVVVGAARTPFGKLFGSLSGFSGPELGGFAVSAALERAGVAPDRVEAVVLGQVLQAGVGQNPARQAAQKAGLPREAHTVTVNKVCLSGLTAVIDAARLLRSGEAGVVVAGGMESMSNAPHLLSGLRRGRRMGDAAAADHLAFDGLRDAETGESMGSLTERFAETYPVDRERQDACALRSHRNAAAARAEGFFTWEIAPVTLPDGAVVDADEGVREGVDAEALAKLRPAFDAAGTVTAGNASQITDGAAAVVLTTRGAAADNGWAVLATLGAPGQIAGPDTALQPKPARALAVALDRQGWSTEDLDLVEVNEAFATVVEHSADALGIAPESVNRCGGAIALGHPIGASGARLVVHAVQQIAHGRAARAGVSLCGGGGQGEALLLSA